VPKLRSVKSLRPDAPFSKFQYQWEIFRRFFAKVVQSSTKFAGGLALDGPSTAVPFSFNIGWPSSVWRAQRGHRLWIRGSFGPLHRVTFAGIQMMLDLSEDPSILG
jgi:hypothetical protein